MKKKLFVLVLAIMLVLPAALFAGSFLGLKVGAAAILNEPIDLEEVNPDYFAGLSFDDLSFGADIRANVSIVELAMLVQGAFDSAMEAAFIWGHVGLGLSLELLGLVDLGITAGPYLAAYVDEGGFVPFFDLDDIANYPLQFRTTADVNLGSLSVGGFLIFDPGVTFANLQDPMFDWGMIEDPTTAVGGISVMFKLF